jgi:hypothetical protein
MPETSETYWVLCWKENVSWPLNEEHSGEVGPGWRGCLVWVSSPLTELPMSDCPSLGMCDGVCEVHPESCVRVSDLGQFELLGLIYEAKEGMPT